MLIMLHMTPLEQFPRVPTTYLLFVTIKEACWNKKENCGIQTGVMGSVRQPFSDSRGHFCKSIMDGL